MSWQHLSLGEMTEPERPITYGVVKPGPEDPDQGVLFVRGGDIREGKIDVQNLRTITQDYSRPYARTILKGGELLISLVGNPGEVAIAPESLVGANIARQVGLIALRSDFHSRYVMYFLKSPAGRSGLFQRTQGAVQQVINLAALKTVKIGLPTFGQQQRIAAILSAYDDLIENNGRRIALLEEAARQLYKEWFVRLRFPGHEHVKIVDGVPEGWERKQIGEISDDISYGYTASADPDIDGPKYLRITDIVKGQISWPDVPRCPIADHKAEQFALRQGDVVVARTGATTGWARRVGRLKEPAVFASYLVRFRFGELLHPTVAAIFMESEAYKAMVWAGIGGAAQPNASAQLLAKPKLVVPPKLMQEAFVREVRENFLMVDNLMEQIQCLASARDLLLPKLMSGAIAV